MKIPIRCLFLGVSLVAASCDGTEPVQRVVDLPAGHVQAPREGFVLATSGALIGKGWGGQTIVRSWPGSAAPIVSSADLATWKASGRGNWSFEGVPTGLIVRDVTIDGQGGVPPNAHLWDLRAPAAAGAVELYAPGSDVVHVKVFDYPGVAVVVGQGHAPMVGWSAITDSVVTRIEGLRTNRTHAGLWVKSSGDGIADDLELIDGRDFGARFDGAAWTISRVHAAGFGARPTKDDPDNGCGIINGPWANYYGTGIQPDNCRVGFRNYGAATSIGELIGKLCSETTVHAVRKLRIARLSIETPGGASWMQHFNPAPRGVVIEPTAAGSILGDEFSEVSTGEATAAVMFSVRANQCEIRNARSSWGGMVDGNTMVEYGSPYERLWGSRIDVWASGCGVGVRLTHEIGLGNVIVVHHDGNCATPVDVGPNRDLRGNDVRVENSRTGTWTTIATMEEQK
jgi:hypothetical protein